MAQFKAYLLPGDLLVLDLQTDLIDTGTRVVAPLIPLATGPRPLPRLEPVLTIDGVAYALHTAELAAVPSGLLNGPVVADLKGEDYALRRALDMVFSGF
jgi:toxin CcdB